MNEPQQGKPSQPVPEKNAAAPGRKSLVAQGLLMAGIVLLLAAAILVLAVRPFLSREFPPAPEKPAAVVPQPAAPVPEPSPVPAAPQVEVPAPVSVPAPIPEPVPAPEPTPAPAPVAAEPQPAGAPVDLPSLVTDAGPDAAISEYVAKMEILGYASGQVLLRLPGQEEARGCREGEVLDDAFPLTILKVTDRRVTFGDDRGHTYSRTY
jgi:outer membrane biosynthesis protein TonB